MLTPKRVRAAFFFFGSLFLFALAIEQKEKVNKNFSFLQTFLIISQIKQTPQSKKSKHNYLYSIIILYEENNFKFDIMK